MVASKATINHHSCLSCHYENLNRIKTKAGYIRTEYCLYRNSLRIPVEANSILNQFSSLVRLLELLFLGLFLHLLGYFIHYLGGSHLGSTRSNISNAFLGNLLGHLAGFETVNDFVCTLGG